MRRMFSEKQIEEMIKSVGKEIDFQDVDLKVKTIKQNEPNWEVDLKPFIEAKSDDDIEYTSIYSKLCSINGELDIIVNYKIRAKRNISGKTIGFVLITLPQEIAEKLVLLNGDKVSDGTSGNGQSLCILQGAFSQDGSTSWSAIYNAFVNGTDTPNELNIYLGLTSQTMSENDEKYVSLRTFLTLI